MSTSRHTVKGSMSYETRETLRQDLINEQRRDAEQGLEMILDGADKAEIHIRNALEIVKDARQGEALAGALVSVTGARMKMWGALGSLNRYGTFGEEL